MGTDAFEVVDRAGRVDVFLTLFEYLRGDWAPCDSVDIAFPAKPAGAPDDQAGIYMCPTVVNYRFNSEAAYWAMRVSRSFARIDVAHEDRSVRFTIQEDGQRRSRITIPRAPGPARSRLTSTRAYTCIGDRPYVIPFEMELPGTPLDTADVHIELGGGPMADRLRALGWPAPVTFSGWGQGLTGRFHAGQAL